MLPFADTQSEAARTGASLRPQRRRPNLTNRDPFVDIPILSLGLRRRADSRWQAGDMENTEPGGREKRRHERFTCDGMAEVVAFRPEFLFRGEVKDISLTGCYITTRARLNLKRFAEIELRFTANGRQLSSLARIMDIRPGKGIGVEFLPGDPRMNKHFRDLIEQLQSQARAEIEGKT